MKLLKTIRFDASDESVFDVAAAPAEWAVSGAFAFVDDTPDSLRGKARQAFANGFLGVESFGRSTFATVATAMSTDLDWIERALANHFVAAYGAPDEAAALSAAAEETKFIRELCDDVVINTLFTVRRLWDGEGRIKEEFRQISPPTAEPLHAKIWTIVDDGS